GIRFRNVTGVQTCALPISLRGPPRGGALPPGDGGHRRRDPPRDPEPPGEEGHRIPPAPPLERRPVARRRPRTALVAPHREGEARSEERRVGKGSRRRSWVD